MEPLPVFDKIPLTSHLDGSAIPVRTANGVLQRNRQGVVKRAAAAYRVTDPTAIAARLEPDGFTVSRCLSIRSAWRFGLEVTYPYQFGDPTEFRYRARILCGNTGRESLQIAPGALRVACLNQFHSDVIRIHHTDSAIEEFLLNPGRTLFNLREHCERVVQELDSLRGVALPLEYAMAVRAKPRLWKAFVPALTTYRRGAGSFGARTVDGWQLAQALTEIKRPSTVEAAAVLLRNREALRQGEHVAEYFDLFEPAKAVETATASA
jgi:hypothetical protein